MQDTLMQSKQASEMLSLSVSSVHRHSDRGTLRVETYLRGGTRLYKLSDVLEFKEKMLKPKLNHSGTVSSGLTGEI